MKSRMTHIEFPVFCDYVLHVEVASDINKALKKYPATEGDKLPESIDAVVVHVPGEPMSFMFLQPDVSVGTIAHESWHAVRRIMEYVGVELDNEAVSYHLGYVVDEVFKFMRSRK